MEKRRFFSPESEPLSDTGTSVSSTSSVLAMKYAALCPPVRGSVVR